MDGPCCRGAAAALLLALCSRRGLAAQALEQRHLEFEGGMYQDYRQLQPGAAATLHGKAVKLWRLKSLRLSAFDQSARELTGEQKGQRCTVAELDGRCKAFRAYNPSVTLLPSGRALVAARLSNWSLCEWSGQGRPYANWPDSKWPDAIYEEYHSHIAFLELDSSELNVASSVPASRAPLSPDVWARTRAPFFEIFRQGLEDPRLFVLGDQVSALAVYGQRAAREEPTRLADSRVEGVGAFRQALLRFDGAGRGVEAEGFAALATDFEKGAQQKNWMPFVHEGKLFVVHQLVPSMKVLAVDEEHGVASLRHETDADPALRALQRAEVRGGSQCVHLPERGVYLGVAHVSRGRGMYTHFFFAFADKPPFGMLGVSREWCVAHDETFQSGTELLCEGVQFVSGLALVPAAEGKAAGLLMAYGVMDCDARIARVPLESALKVIKFRKGKAEEL